MDCDGVKGSEAETVAQQILESDGYIVHRARPNKVKRGGRWFTNSNDLFGCIDILATKKGHPFLFVQVCQSSGVRLRRRKIEAVPWPGGDELVEIWEARPGPAFRIHVFIDNGFDWYVRPELLHPPGGH